jgi:hypothetical protein
MVQLGIRRLGALGVHPDETGTIAAGAHTATSSCTNPVPPEDFAFDSVLEACLRT